MRSPAPPRATAIEDDALFDPAPFTQDEIWREFEGGSGFGRHLLTVHSIAVGLNARRIVDLGLGATTRALRLAASRTGGVVMSCDVDADRFAYLLDRQDASWRLHLGPSERFLESVEAPFDLVVHDAAHDYYQVRMDLERILPRMSRFGVVCVHDTQQPDLAADMLAALRDATAGHAVSMVVLPYAAGLAILRVEESPHPPVQPASGRLDDGRSDTLPVPFPMRVAEGTEIAGADTSLRRWLRWRLRKLVKGW